MKGEKGEGNSYKTVTSTEGSKTQNVEVEVIELRRIMKYTTLLQLDRVSQQRNALGNRKIYISVTK